MSTKHVGRRATTSPLRRATLYVLGAGIVLAVATAFGSVWIARAGIALAILTAIVGVRFAWAELRQARKEHGVQLLDQLASHGTQLTTERERTREVLDALRQTNADNDEELDGLRTRIGQLRTELDSLRGIHAGLQIGLIKRDEQIKRLTIELEAREQELRQMQGAADQAEVLSMPRYAEAAAKPAKADWDALPSAEELWSQGNYPSVADLQKLAYPPVEREIRKQA